MSKFTPVGLFLAALCSCSVDVERALPPIDVTSVPAVPSSTSVRIGGSGWGEAPFPGPLFLGDGPRIPSAFPNPRADGAVFDDIRELAGHRSGFCTSCNVVFGFDGELATASLPGAAEFVDLSDGQTMAADFEWRSDEQTLTVRPQRPHVLRPSTHYAVVLSGLRGADGLPVLMPAGTVLDPTLQIHGFDADTVAGFTTFVTDDPAQQVRSIRESIVGAPGPIARIDSVHVGAAIDELLGSASQIAPGFDRADPADPTVFAVRHATTQLVLTGSFDAQRFVDGEGTDIGVVRRDESGMPISDERHDVPFVLIIPKDADLENLPVVIMHHGFNASRVTALSLADTAGAAGWAVLGIDAYQHGERAPTAKDAENVMRRSSVPDGFAETNKLDVVSRVFGFTGVPSDRVLSPAFALSAFLQFAADAISAIHFVREGDIAALRSQAGLGELAFDAEHIAFVGNSMGAVVGTAVIAAEPNISGAVLNVMPGSIIETLVESGEFRPLSERVLLPLLGVQRSFDEVEHSMLMDPTVDMFRWVLEPVDPLALVHSRLVDNVLVQLAGHDEVAAPRPSASVVEAGEFERLTVYPGAMHGMMEVNAQESRFEAPLVPPLVRRQDSAVVDNPTSAVHDEITDFLLAIETK